MVQLWQLKKITNNQPLNEPQPLPENWGPIFGMSGFIERLGDLSWLGPDYADQGWFVVGEDSNSTTITTQSKSDEVWERSKQLLRDSDWSVLPDVIMTKADKESWYEYRKALREIKLQPGFPNEVQWPSAPN